MLSRCAAAALWVTLITQGRIPGTFFRTRVVLREHVGWMEGPEGSGPSNFVAFLQKALKITPMIEQPTITLTPSIMVKDGLRMAKA